MEHKNQYLVIVIKYEVRNDNRQKMLLSISFSTLYNAGQVEHGIYYAYIPTGTRVPSSGSSNQEFNTEKTVQIPRLNLPSLEQFHPPHNVPQSAEHWYCTCTSTFYPHSGTSTLYLSQQSSTCTSICFISTKKDY